MSDGFTTEPLNPIPAEPLPIMPPSRNRLGFIFKLLIGVAVCLGIVSVLIFYFGGSSFTESKVLLTLEGPTQASVGDEVIYKVHYENMTNTTLNHLKLSFIYPESSVIIQDGQPVNSPGNVLSTDQADLKPGASLDQEFHVFLVGDRGNIKVARVKLAFLAGDLKSPFEKTAQVSTTITTVPLALTFVGPPNTVSGQLVTYILDYRNQSTEDVSGLQLTMDYPDGFTPGKITPSASTGTTIWNLPLVKKGAGGRITIQGVLTGGEGDSKNFNATLKRKIDNTFVDFGKGAVATVISSPLLSVDTTVNGSADYVSHAGDTLQYQIHYKNTSNFTFSGLILSVKLEGSMFDFSNVDGHTGFYDSSNHTVTWNTTVIPAFNALAPQAAGTVNITAKLLPSASGGGSSNLFARATVQFSTPNVPDTINADTVSVTDDVVTKITSQPTLRQTMYYSDAMFGSSGVMPPQAGKDTVFTIHWQVVNPGNPLTGAKLVGTLPQGVTWKNVVSAGPGQPQPSFNSNTSQVIWNLGTLPSGIGIGSVPAYDLAFRVTVRPSPNQTGSPAPVMSGVALSGTDSYTAQNIVVNGADLTTNSTIDQPGQGVVQ